MADQPFCRLTVLAPRHSVDVALPSDVPVAELVPMVLELLGEPERSRAAAPRPWRLSGVAGGPLPAAATLTELGVLDGELLRLAPAASAPSAPVFDDPVDALAAGAETGAGARAPVRGGRGLGRRGGGVRAAQRGRTRLGGRRTARRRWCGHRGDRSGKDCSPRHCRSGPRPCAGPQRRARRRRSRRRRGLERAAAARGHRVADGGRGGRGHVAAAAAQLVLRVVAPTLVAAGVVAVVTVAAVMAVRLGAGPIPAASAAAALAIVGAPLLPRVAIRLAGLPRPAVPADGSELTDDEAQLSAAELAERGDLARGYLAGLTGGASVITAVGALFAASGSGWAGPVFAGVTAVVLLLRARGYTDAAPARTALTAAVVTAVGVAHADRCSWLLRRTPGLRRAAAGGGRGCRCARRGRTGQAPRALPGGAAVDRRRGGGARRRSPYRWLWRRWTCSASCANGEALTRCAWPAAYASTARPASARSKCRPDGRSRSAASGAG